MTNALRGHPLNGRKFKTPDGVLGVVYEENKTKVSETNRVMKVNSVFDEYVYWNYDKIPSDNDAIIKALDWIEISKSVRLNDFRIVCTRIHMTTKFTCFVFSVPTTSRS